ncbi:hypothetical protein KL925_005090 [Ogataea polymorpha]|nr:hypothetical protein KL925_005090 [Ogataea polymorpha]
MTTEERIEEKTPPHVSEDVATSLESGLMPEISKVDNIAVEKKDVVLSKKMYLINNAIDEIGFTWYHAKLFCIAGYGYSVDSQMEMIQSSVHSYVAYQFGTAFPIDTEIAYAGLIIGSIFWGFGGDLIGRRLCFNTSLLLTSMFGFLAGGMSSMSTYCIFVALANFSAGGNLAMDVAVFLEYLPFKYQYLNTVMAAWWGVGQTTTNLLAWAFLPNFSCSSADYCPSSINRGWRYTWYVNSAIVLASGLLRLFWFKLDETPKFLVSVGRDAEAVANLQKLARKYNRKCSLTLEQLQECGDISSEYYAASEDGWDPKKILSIVLHHCKILYQDKINAWSTSLILLSWLFIGISYSVFYNFLYIYIASHGGDTGSSTYIVYRNSSLANFVGIFGPIVAGYIILLPKVGRRYTMSFGALATMAILFGYTTVRTPSGDAGFSSATYFFINIYYGCLYAYTPEVLPAQARGTGVGLALVAARVSGAFSPVTYWYGQKSGSAIPIWVCGGIIGSLGIISALLPFEPSKQRSV